MALTQIYPAQIPQHYQEDNNGSTTPTFSYGGALFMFLADGVGFPGDGGGTNQYFIRKSTDNGVTWVDITPAAPQKFEGQSGGIFVQSGSVVYMPFYNSTTLKMFGFSLATQTWLADGPLATGVPTGWIEYQAAVRTNGQIVLIFGQNGAGNLWLAVYDPGTATWVAEPATIGISPAQICGAGVDSVGHLHFFGVTWSVSLGTGTATVQHFLVNADNSISGPNLVYTFVHPPDTQFPWIAVGQPAFYLDVTPNQRTIAIPIGVPNADPGGDDITGLVVMLANESDTPVWSQVVVPTGENFAQVYLGNSQTALSPCAVLQPVQFSSQTQLFIFWTSNGQTQAIGTAPWNNFFRHIVYTNSVFSAVTTDFQSLGTKIIPGPFYPIVVSNNGTSAVLNGMLPTIDMALFVSLVTKYASLGQYWLADPASGPGGVTVAPIIAGGMGCVPQCVDPCAPVDAKALSSVNRGGDPAIVLALLTALVVLESA